MEEAARRHTTGKGSRQHPGTNQTGRHVRAVERRFTARRRPEDRGAAAVEFALVLTPLLVVVFGILQYGWYFNSLQSGTSAAADAARRLSVGDCQSLTQLTSMVESRLGAASAGEPVAVTVTYTAADAARTVLSAPGVVGGDVTVRVEFQSSHFRLPFIPVPNDGEVVRTAAARIEDTTASIVGC